MNLVLKFGPIFLGHFFHFSKHLLILWTVSLELEVDNTDTDEACDSSFEEGNFSPKIEFVEKFYPLPSSYFTPRSILHFTLWESSSSRPQNSSFSHQTLNFNAESTSLPSMIDFDMAVLPFRSKRSIQVCQIGNDPNSITNCNFDHLLMI